MSPAQKTDPKALTAAVLRDLFRLAGRVRLDLGDDGGLVPLMSSGDLWRVMPRLIDRACDLADVLCDGAPEVLADTAAMRVLSATIKGARCPGVGR